jgi:hypothetical protein
VFAFLIRIGFCLGLSIAHTNYGAPLFQAEYSNLFRDDLNYHKHSILIAEQIQQHGYTDAYNLAKLYYPVNPGYAYLGGIVYRLLGTTNTMAVRLVNSLFGALIPVLCFMIAHSVYDNFKIARYSAILTAFLPTSIVLSSLHYKDTVIIFLILYIAWVSLTLSKKISVTNVCLFLLALFALATFRFVIFVALAGIVLLNYLARKGLTFSTVSLVVLILLVSAFTVYLYDPDILLYLYSPTHFYQIVEKVNHAYINVASDTSLASRLSASNAGIIPRLIFNGILFIVAPLPNSTLGIFVFGLPGVWLWYLLIPAVYYGTVYSLRKKIKNTWLLLSIPAITLMMVSTSFSANNLRYREQAMPVLLILSSVGIVHCRKLKAIYPLYFPVLGLLALAYYCVKYL